jgi:peptide-N4-(N-acetyl-beta-glucosaminyl)asparagine amidase
MAPLTIKLKYKSAIESFVFTDAEQATGATLLTALRGRAASHFLRDDSADAAQSFVRFVAARGLVVTADGDDAVGAATNVIDAASLNNNDTLVVVATARGDVPVAKAAVRTAASAAATARFAVGGTSGGNLTEGEVTDALTVCSGLYVKTAMPQPTFSFTYFARDDPDGIIYDVCGPCAHTCFKMKDVDILSDVGHLRKPFACACCSIKVTDHACAWREDRGAMKVDQPTAGVMRTAWLTEHRDFVATVSASLDASTADARRLGLEQMTERVRHYQESFEQYYDEAAVRLALAAIPVAKLQDLAAAAGDGGDEHFHDEVLKQLLHWFKHDFFTWVTTPSCEACSGAMRAIFVPPTAPAAVPLPEERENWASRIELYQCTGCHHQQRFPRYNRATRLLTWRKGRCGEWANCFTLCCIALGYDARIVYDFTDHIWTEVYSAGRGRWVHCDPCENAFDAPLMYETGWGKKLTYIVAVSKEEVVDVTRRYSKAVPTLGRAMLSEAALSALLRGMGRVANLRVAPERLAFVEDRARLERRELCGAVAVTAEDRGGATHVGRQTGDAAWNRARGEDGLSDRSADAAAGSGSGMYVSWRLPQRADAGAEATRGDALALYQEAPADDRSAARHRYSALFSHFTFSHPIADYSLGDSAAWTRGIALRTVAKNVETADPVALPVPPTSHGATPLTNELRFSLAAEFPAKTLQRSVCWSLARDVRVEVDIGKARCSLFAVGHAPISASRVSFSPPVVDAWQDGSLADTVPLPDRFKASCDVRAVVETVVDSTGALRVSVEVADSDGTELAVFGTMLPLALLPAKAPLRVFGTACVVRSVSVSF